MFHLAETLEHTRQQFLAAGHTLANVRRDFPEWHQGRPHYALWALDLDVPHLRDMLARAASRLSPWLLDDYRRQPHITLAVAGFPCPSPSRPDDYGPADLARHRARLAQSAPPPFRIRIGPASSFSSAPFLSVEDPSGGIAQLRQLLDAPAQQGDPPYIPHLTLGLYSGAYPCALLLDQLERISWPSIQLDIRSVSLMHYAAPIIGGPLEIVERHFLDPQDTVGRTQTAQI
jgi:2'-5' RNA ligase